MFQMPVNKVTDLFNKSGLEKIVFNPPIIIKLTPHSNPVKITEIERMKEKIMITATKDRNDSGKLDIRAIDDRFLTSLSIRLYSLYGSSKNDC